MKITGADLRYYLTEAVGIAGVLATPDLGPTIDADLGTHGLGKLVVGICALVALIGGKVLKATSDSRAAASSSEASIPPTLPPQEGTS